MGGGPHVGAQSNILLVGVILAREEFFRFAPKDAQREEIRREE